MTLLAVLLGVIFLGSGVGRVVAPGHVRHLVPPWMPAPATIVWSSGAADVVVGVLLCLPSTRALGGAAATVLLVIYLVPHLDAARPGRRGTIPLSTPAWLVIRLAVTLAYLAAAVAVARNG